MRFSLSVIIVVFCLSVTTVRGQKTLCLGFYNVENLYDTINTPGKRDGEFTPEGKMKWNTRKYDAKLAALSRSISFFRPDILGLCEVENRAVLEDLVKQPELREEGYDIVHYDSPDGRGSDVALIYRSGVINVISSEPICAPGQWITRDILKVNAKADGLKLSIYVVHLPSRRGNDTEAARQRRKLVEALDLLCCAELEDDPSRCVVVCGDFNDNPDTKLFHGLMPEMYNASSKPYSEGKGSYAWRDVWQMYDQIFVSGNMLEANRKWRLAGDAVILNRPELLQASGRFASYPAKGKISDHLPVFVKFAKD